MRIFKEVTLIIWALLALGCSFAATKVDLTSEPKGAQVVLISSNGREDTVGETPLQLNQQNLRSGDQGMTRIKLNKEGFVTEQILLENLATGKQGSIHVTMKPLANWSQAFVDEQANRYLTDVASTTAEIQGATIKGDYGKAESLARTLITRYPKLAIGWTLMGNIYFLQKRVSDALEAYQKSLTIDPSSQQTRDVIERIRGAQIR